MSHEELSSEAENGNSTEQAQNPIAPAITQEMPDTKTSKPEGYTIYPEGHPKPPKRGFHPVRRFRAWLRHPRRERPKWTDIAIAGLTVGIVLLAGAQVYEMIDAGTQTDKIIVASQQIQHALEAANGQYLDGLTKTLEQSKENMELSAKQNKSVLDATVDQFHLDERPWLDISIENHLPEKGFIEVGQPWDIRGIFKNVGKTPTVHEKMNIRRELIPQNHGTLVVPSFSKENEKIVPVDSLGLNDTAHSDDVLTPSLAQIQFEQIMNKDTVVFVWGTFWFDDVFGKHHWNDFCGYMLTGGGFTSCTVHNGQDAD